MAGGEAMCGVNRGGAGEVEEEMGGWRGFRQNEQEAIGGGGPRR